MRMITRPPGMIFNRANCFNVEGGRIQRKWSFWNGSVEISPWTRRFKFAVSVEDKTGLKSRPKGCVVFGVFYGMYTLLHPTKYRYTLAGLVCATVDSPTAAFIASRDSPPWVICVLPLSALNGVARVCLGCAY